MAKHLLSVLQNIGLHDDEAELYLAGLTLGMAPASDYAKAAGMNRITAYNTLESLVEDGYFSLVKQTRGKCYAPVSPEQLSSEVRKHADALHHAVPEFKSLRGAEYRKPEVRFFHGWEGVRHVYDDTLTAKGEILNFANSAVVRSFWPEYDAEYVAQRVKKGIHLRGIAPDDDAGRRVHGEDRKKIREIRLVPGKDFDFTNEINIYDHKVAICSYPSGSRSAQDAFGVIIESKEVAETQRQIFEMAWRYSGKHPRK
jgi:sugar-specific transcriptional regulator TrmB